MPMTSGFPRHRMDDHQTKHMNIRLGKKNPQMLFVGAGMYSNKKNIHWAICLG